MKVILEQDVKSLGKKGDIVEVSEGYARNFLVPKKLAVAATSENINAVTQKKASVARKKEQEFDEAKVMASQMDKIEVTIETKLGENGKMFGSITSKDIADAILSEHKVEIDRRKIDLKDAIKSPGDYTVTIKIHPTISSKIVVHVTAV